VIRRVRGWSQQEQSGAASITGTTGAAGDAGTGEDTGASARARAGAAAALVFGTGMGRVVDERWANAAMAAITMLGEYDG
jgi:hypothetical protein